MARLLDHLLARHGYVVRIASSISSARQELQLSPADLVILDRLLPDGDGLELARELRSDRGSLCRYVLMLTSVSSAAAKVEGIDGGADDYVTKPFSHDELLARVRAGLRIVELQRALISVNRKLELMSVTDAVTDVKNRRWFDDELERAFAHASRYSRPLSVAVLDIDHFKSVNDIYGHLSGDAVLRAVCTRAGDALRKTDSLARVGGEEFAIILPETGLFEAAQAAEKIRTAIESSPIHVGGDRIAVTVSIGVASVPHSKFTRAAQFLSFADQALYRAKNRGRNRVELERRSTPWRTSQPQPAAVAARVAS